MTDCNLDDVEDDGGGRLLRVMLNKTPSIAARSVFIRKNKNSIEVHLIHIIDDISMCLNVYGIEIDL